MLLLIIEAGYMKGNKIEVKGRNWEGIIVIILLMVVFAVLTPYVTKIIYNAQVTGAISSIEGLSIAVKTTYTEGNLTGVIALPFEVKYEDKEYVAYSNGAKIDVEIKVDGSNPKSGSIIINRDGAIEIQDLKYGLVTCNKKAEDSEATCE